MNNIKGISDKGSMNVDDSKRLSNQAKLYLGMNDLETNIKGKL